MLRGDLFLDDVGEWGFKPYSGTDDFQNMGFLYSQPALT